MGRKPWWALSKQLWPRQQKQGKASQSQKAGKAEKGGLAGEGERKGHMGILAWGGGGRKKEGKLTEGRK